METGPTAVPAVRPLSDVAPVVLANQLLENSSLKLEPIKDDWRRRGPMPSTTDVGPRPVPMWIRHLGAGLVLLVLAALVWEVLRKQM